MINKRNIVYLFIFIIFQSCKNDLKKDVNITNVEFKHEGNLSILDSSNNLLKNIEIEIAVNNFEKQTG
jgi:hypothetical protein